MSEMLAPPPPMDPAAPMIARTERIVIERPPEAVFAVTVAGPLEQMVPATRRLPGVAGVTPITPGPWGAVGGRRRVHLTDGAATTEQVLESVPGERFRYQVWDYTTAAAKPIAYAVGEFRFKGLDGGRTELTWTYAFRLRDDRFPGVLGGAGRWLVRKALVDGPYAELMTTSLAAIKALVEQG